MDIAEAAQAVQRSADGSAYAQHEGQGPGHRLGALRADARRHRLRARRSRSSPVTPRRVAALLAKDFGLEGAVDGRP